MQTKAMKTNIRSVCQSFAGAIVAGALLVIAGSAPAQNLFVADFGSHIYEITPGGVVSTFATDLSQANSLAFDKAGNLFASDSGSYCIYKYAPDGTRTTFASGITLPNAIAFDSAGNLFVTSDGVGIIYKFTPAGVQSTFATGLNWPDGLAFDSAGNPFVADSSNDAIYEYTPSGVQSTFASGTGGPAGLAFDSSGNLYDADYESGNIYEFTPSGARTTFASGLGEGGPNKLAFDSAGNLFESNGGSGYVYKFAPDGTRTTFASGLGDPSGVAFQPPPPSTCPSIVGTWTGQVNVANAFRGYSTIPLTVQVTDQSTNGCLVRGYLTQGSVSNSIPNIGIGFAQSLPMPFTGTIPDASTVLLNVGGVGSGKASGILDLTQTPPVLTKFVYQPGNGETLTGNLTLQPSSP